jgi:SAM-dependent methyltransferase/spore coat polysaccharide biosynthesis protein SpsF (cytidylyltransferase family)
MMQWVVQASSQSWSGGQDICMNPVQGQPAVFHTVNRILTNFPDSKVVVAAPEFDRSGSLPAVLGALGSRVEIFYGFTQSPLQRMVKAAEAHFEGDAFLRLDGLNMFFRLEHAQALWQLGTEGALDVAKFPDDYPVQFTADFYRVSALRALGGSLAEDSPLQIHPKYALMRNPAFRAGYLDPGAPLSDEVLQAARDAATALYVEPRDVINGKRIASGDTLSLHYAMALPFIQPDMETLDIACGGWYGPGLLAQKARRVVGADVDPVCIQQASEKMREVANLTFQCEDVTAMSFADASFDLITSFETIEHVDAQLYVKEMHRVLKPHGLLLMSTPQNSLGHIPMNPQHQIEYSLDEVLSVVSSHFECESAIGIKQGCVYIDGEVKGTNTFLRLRRRALA